MRTPIILFFCALLSFGIVAESSNFTKPHWTFHAKKYDRHHFKGLKKNSHNPSHFKSIKKTDIIIPNTFDLRGKISQIEDQGNCGSCWCFSLTALLRDVWLLSGKDPGRLSQQYCVDCAPGYGCSGGYFDGADAFISPKGAPLWSDYPYKAKDQRCETHPIAASIKAWHMIGNESTGPSIREIETVIVSTGGPVSITVAAGAGYWEDYSGGVYNDCRRATTDHMINIVGWDNEEAVFDKDGNLPPGNGVWILRNSWGEEWGEKGFMLSKMTDSRGRRCNNVAEEASYFDIEVPPTPTPTPIPPVPPIPPQPFLPMWAWIGFALLIVGIALWIFVK